MMLYCTDCHVMSTLHDLACLPLPDACRLLWANIFLLFYTSGVWFADNWFRRADVYCTTCVYRVWDVHNKTEINKLEFPASVADIELSSDGKLLTAAYANKVAFWNVDTSVCCSSCFLLFVRKCVIGFNTGLHLSVVKWLIYSFIHSFIHSFVHSLIYWFTCKENCWPESRGYNGLLQCFWPQSLKATVRIDSHNETVTCNHSTCINCLAKQYVIARYHSMCYLLG